MKTQLLAIFLIALSFFFQAFAEGLDEKIILQRDVTTKLGGSEVNGEWSYSFLNMDPNSMPSLINQNNGKTFFEDENWLVTVQESEALNSNRKSEITFYDSQTLKTIAVARVPNCIQKIGKIPSTNFFYFLTIKFGKYNYDDAPLVLILIDPINKELERVRIVEGDHWLANEDIALIPGESKLTVKLPTTRFNDYKKSIFQKSSFSNIKISYTSGAELLTDSLFCNNVNHDKYDGINRKSLSHLNLQRLYFDKNNLDSNQNYADRFDFINATNKSSSGILFGRTLQINILQTINLANFSKKDFKIPLNKISKLGFFDSGTIWMLSSNELFLLYTANASSLKSIGFTENTRVSFDKNNAFFITPSQNDNWNPLFEGLNAFKWLVIDKEGRAKEQRLNQDVLKMFNPKIHDFSIFPEQEIIILNQRPRFFQSSDGALHPTGASGEGGPNIFEGLSLSNCNKLINSIQTETYVYGSSLEVKIDGINQDWKVASVISAYYPTNGNRLYDIFLQGPTNADKFKLTSGLSELPKLLKCLAAPNCNVNVIYSVTGKTTLLVFNPVSKKVVCEKQWHSPSGKSDPQYIDQANLLCIPRAYGYDAFKLIDSAEAELAFSLHLGATGSYAVVLPNGSFAGSPGCEELINLSAGDGMVGASAVFPWRNRPAEVLKALGGDPEQIEVLSKVTDRWLKKLGNPERNPEPTAAEIPFLSLSNDVPLWAKSDEVILTFDTKPGTGPVKEVIVRVNGVDQQRGANSAANHSSIERAIKLAEGQNWIEAVAIDEKGRSSNLVRFRTILSKAAKPSKRFIIALGVSKYKDTSMNLAFAAKDANDLSAALKASSPSSAEVLILTDESVTKDALGKIRDFLSSATENDEIIAFCAGHGTLDKNLDYLFVGHDFDQARPSETGIKLDGLVEAIGSSKSLNRLLLLDTCHSGQVGEKEELLLAHSEGALPKGVRAVKQRGMSVKPVEGLTADAQQRFIEEMFLLPGLHRGINIIGASGGAEFALESSEWNNGVFTSSIIEALRDKKADENCDARITVSELRDYLARRVPELTRGAQKPSVVANERDQDFDLIKAAFKRTDAVENPANNSIEESSVLPSSGSLNPESFIRGYYQSIEARNESKVSNYIANQVDYMSSGSIPKSKVMADIRGDWKRYSNSTFAVSEFVSAGPTSCQFILDYSLMQGDRPRRGKLQMNATLSSDQPQKIIAIKAKVISAK